MSFSAKLEVLIDAWRRLVETDPDGNVFQTPLPKPIINLQETPGHFVSKISVKK